MEINDTIIVPRDTMMDIIHCMNLMLELINKNTKNPSNEDIDKLKYVNKTFYQSIELFTQLQNQLNKKP